MTEKKELTSKEQLELNRELKEVVEVFVKKSKELKDLKDYYRKFRDLINQGAKCRVTKPLVEAMFKYKFYCSCKNAKERTENREDYKKRNVQYLLGDTSTAFERLKEERPDLYKDGLKIIKDYLEESIKIGKMADWSAMCIHRVNDSGNYDWNNIQILRVDKHREITQKPKTLIKFTTKGLDVSVFPSMRSMSEKLQISTSTISRGVSKFIQTENEKLIWFGNKQLNDMKKPFKNILRHCEQLKKEHSMDSTQYNSYDVLFEMLYSFGESIGIIKRKEQNKTKK